LKLIEAAKLVAELLNVTPEATRFDGRLLAEPDYEFTLMS
jgi:hypothetical protein